MPGEILKQKHFSRHILSLKLVSVPTLLKPTTYTHMESNAISISIAQLCDFALGNHRVPSQFDSDSDEIDPITHGARHRQKTGQDFSTFGWKIDFRWKYTCSDWLYVHLFLAFSKKCMFYGLFFYILSKMATIFFRRMFFTGFGHGYHTNHRALQIRWTAIVMIILF